jgi:signal transduction histidine kinase
MADTGRRLTRGFGLKVTLFTAFIVAILSLVQFFVLYPRFIQRVVEDSRDEAVRSGKHISRMLVGNRPLDRGTFSSGMVDQIMQIKEDFQLWKMNVFSRDGEVIFSTDPENVGRVNDNDYFFEIVSQGTVFSKTVWQKEVTLEGETVPLDVVETYVPLMDGSEFTGACEIYYDITERKKGIDRLIKKASVVTLGIGGALLALIGILVGKVEGAAREQERLQEQLIRSDRLAAIGTLVGGMTHEFNNINVTVMGFSQLALEKCDLAPDVRDHFTRINRAAKRANSITNNLLDFTREGKSSFRRGNLAQAAQEAVDLVRDQYEKEGIQVRNLVHPVPDSTMDADQIVQVILNLCANARHALTGMSRRVLSIETGSEGEMVFVKVSDTGCGIGEEDLSRIFTPFFSLKGEYARDRAQAAHRGTGLGLSVCHTIVKNHGGEMEAESRIGSGSHMTVRLPVAPGGAGGPGEGDSAA